jgi:hypothetical protein
MRVINQTVWRTDHLRAILQRCARQEFDDGSRRKKLIVTVEYTRKGGSSGCAWIGGSRATVRIATPKAVAAGLRFGSRLKVMFDGDYMAFLKCSFASVACHEFAHCRGMEHRGMPKHYKWASESWKAYVAWAEEMPLDQKAAQVAPTPAAVVNAKLAHVIRMRERAERRLKRYRNIVRKWTAKERYYEKRKAAARPMEEGEQ